MFSLKRVLSTKTCSLAPVVVLSLQSGFGERKAHAEGCGFLLPLCAVFILPVLGGMYIAEEVRDSNRRADSKKMRRDGKRQEVKAAYAEAYRLIVGSIVDSSRPLERDFGHKLAFNINTLKYKCIPVDQPGKIYEFCANAAKATQAFYENRYPGLKTNAEYRAVLEREQIPERLVAELAMYQTKNPDRKTDPSVYDRWRSYDYSQLSFAKTLSPAPYDLTAPSAVSAQP